MKRLCMRYVFLILILLSWGGLMMNKSFSAPANAEPRWAGLHWVGTNLTSPRHSLLLDEMKNANVQVQYVTYDSEPTTYCWVEVFIFKTANAAQDAAPKIWKDSAVAGERSIIIQKNNVIFIPHAPTLLPKVEGERKRVLVLANKTFDAVVADLRKEP